MIMPLELQSAQIHSDGGNKKLSEAVSNETMDDQRALKISQPAANITQQPLGFLTIISLQRSASTSLLYKVLKLADACLVEANEIFQNTTHQTQAWAIAGEGLHGGVKNLAPKVLQNFLLKARRLICSRRPAATEQACEGRCVLAFKQFGEHLTFEQHAAVWALPNTTLVVLERPSKDRFRSKYYALKTHDWDTEGTTAHFKNLHHTAIPPMPEGDEYCDRTQSKDERGALCHFASKHASWYGFVRKSVPPKKRIEVGFAEVVGSDASGVVARIEADMCSNGVGASRYCALPTAL